MQFVNTASKGMNSDMNEMNLDSQTYSFALNATVEDFDGKTYNLGNTPSNYLLSLFDEGERVVGKINVIELDKVFFFIVNSKKGFSSIKYLEKFVFTDENSNFEYSDCLDCKKAEEQTPLEKKLQVPLKPLHTLVESSCLGFDIQHKLNIVYKLTDCTLNFYFVDGNKADKYIYFDVKDNVLTLSDKFKVQNGIDDCNAPVYLDTLDCSKVLWYETISVPCASTTFTTGGQLNSGVYQVLFSYATSKGQNLTSFLSATSPIPLFTQKVAESTQYDTNSALVIDISNIKTGSKYQFINIVVAHTLRGTTTFRLVKTLPITGTTAKYIYTGNEQAPVLSYNDIFFKNTFYEKSRNVALANDFLFKANLKEYNPINIQAIANKLQGALKWYTVCLKEGDFATPEIAQKYRSYARDEIYPFGIQLYFTRGEYTSTGVIPSRMKNSNDATPIANNPDATVDNCFPIQKKEKWELYNTAYITNQHELQYNVCDPRIYQEGEFSYWESTELYPNNKSVYGELCSTPIRHHKFPDSTITHIHDKKNNFQDVNYIFPLGVKLSDDVNIQQILLECVEEGILTQEEFDSIGGYRIVRGNRVGNESISARGIVFDMWNYQKEEQTYFFPNFPLNDLRKNDFLIQDKDLNFQFGEGQLNLTLPLPLEFQPANKYTFHSPDTHFSNPTLGNTIVFDVEEYGQSEGFFNKCEEQAELKILPEEQYNLAIVLGTILGELVEFKDGAQGQASTIGQSAGSIVGGVAGSVIPGVGTAIGAGVGGVLGGLIGGAISNNDNLDQFWRANTILSQVEKILQLFKLLANYENYHWQFQTVGKYTNYAVVPNEGNKIRKIETSAYLESDRLSVSLNAPSVVTNKSSIFINNWLRESSVFLQTNKGVPNAGSVSGVIDNSRYPISQSALGCDYRENSIEYRNTSAYYTTIKNERLNQYGSIGDIDWLPTGCDVFPITEKFKIFGGDKFIGRFALKIKHPFFTRTLFRAANDSDIWYSEYPNVAFPKYFFDTTYKGYTAISLNGTGNPLIDVIINMLVTGITPSEVFQATVQTKAKFKWWYLVPGAQAFAIYDYALYASAFSKYVKHIGNFFRGTLLDPFSFFKVPAYNLDCVGTNYDKETKLFSTRSLQGKIYLYSYGIPYFIVESDYNVDLRYAQNTLEKDFYPRQQDLDSWLQEKNVSPKYDNFYFYNTDYSKQNHEQFISKYDINYNPNENCKIERPNRVIYSLQGGEVENDNFRDSYLFNRGLDYKDFDFKNGKLQAIHQIENDKVLIQFENDSVMYGAYQTLQTDVSTVIVGNGSIFNSKPLEFSKPALGYFGTQHDAFLSTEYGHVSVDAKRGQVFLLSPSGNGLEELSRDGMKHWFKNNLPFTMQQYFPSLDIDNAYNGIGISLSFDKRFNSFYLTKLDYQPLYKTIQYIDGKFFYENKEISISNGKYFCNKSWTISYNFYKKEWVSFHSFTPHYYIDGIDWFITGLNAPQMNSKQLSSAWIHNISNKSYQVFYGKLHPFVVETTSKWDMQYKKLTDVQYFADVVRVHNEFDKVNVRTNPYNKSIVYTDFANTGTVHLIQYNPIDSSHNFAFPKNYTTHREIIVNQKKEFWTINDLKNKVRSDSDNIPKFINSCNNVEKYVNLAAMDMVNNQMNKHVEGNQFKIRFVNDDKSNYKIVHKATLINSMI